MRARRARDVQPRFGVRIRLAHARRRDAGRSPAATARSSGSRVPELVRLVERLEATGAPDCSCCCISTSAARSRDIQVLKQAVKEITQVYARARRARRAGALSRRRRRPRRATTAAATANDEGINYSLQEYANAVVLCRARRSATTRKVPQPVLVSESGRAITAHHSVLVVAVLGAYGKDRIDETTSRRRSDDTARGARLRRDARRRVGSEARNADENVDELLEAYHDASRKPPRGRHDVPARLPAARAEGARRDGCTGRACARDPRAPRARPRPTRCRRRCTSSRSC